MPRTCMYFDYYLLRLQSSKPDLFGPKFVWVGQIEVEVEVGLGQT